MNKNLIFGGIIFIFSGLYSYNKGWSGKFMVEIPPLISCALAITGLIALFFGIFPTKEMKKKRSYICKVCKKKFDAKHVEILICPLCDGQLLQKREDDT